MDSDPVELSACDCASIPSTGACAHTGGTDLDFPQPWVGSTLTDGHWLRPPPHPQAPSLINDLVFLIYEQPLQTRVGAPYGPACPAQLELERIIK